MAADVPLRLAKKIDVLRETRRSPRGDGLSTDSEPCSYWADKGKELISEKYATLEGVEDACDMLGISTSHLRESFQLAYGTTPKAYLDNFRIEKAKILLLGHGATGDGLSMLKVAKAVGYRNTSTFRRAFKKITGVSPSDFKKEG